VFTFVKVQRLWHNFVVATHIIDALVIKKLR